MDQRSMVARRYSAFVRLGLAGSSRRSPGIPALVVLGCAVAAMASSTQGASAADRRAPSAEARLRAHLDGQRVLMISRLNDYWTRGDFVENPDPKGGPGHFIFDGRGKPCPLAKIIIDSGRRDLVEQAARENNGVKVADLTEGPIVDWILASGLTQEECIMIQAPSRSGADIARSFRTEEARRLVERLSRVEDYLRESRDESLTIAVRRMMAAQRSRT